MSTAELYVLNNKSTRLVAEFRNGWGTGPCIWDHMASKYFHDINFTDFSRTQFISREKKNQMVWGLAGDHRVTPEERMALMMTFDRSYVPTANLKAAGEACVSVAAMIAECGFWNGVNHWKAIGEKLIDLSAQKFRPQARGVVLNCTSVNNVWAYPTSYYLKNAWPIFGDLT